MYEKLKKLFTMIYYALIFRFFSIILELSNFYLKKKKSPFAEKNKKNMSMSRQIIFILLLICNILMCLSLSVITPFFPPYAISRGVTEEVVGFIISANPIGAFFASIALGKILNEVKGVNISKNYFCFI